MNVGYLVHTFPSLSETFVLNQIVGVIDEGVDVRIFPEMVGSYESVHEDVAQYNLHRAVVHHPLPAKRVPRAFDATRGFLKQGVRHPALYGAIAVGAVMAGRRRGLRFWHDIAWRGAEYAACDLLCCHHGPQGLRAVALKKAGVVNGPIVVFIHGYDITQYVDQHGERCYDDLFEHADLLLPISERWKDKLIRLGCPPHKVHVHRMGVDLDKFTFQERLAEERQNPVRLVSVARLTEKKGIRYAIEAVGLLRDRGHDILYEVVGDGEERTHLEQLIEELNLQDCVHLVGKKYDQVLLRTLDEADIFVLPSVTTQDGDQEGLPVVLMEAMALGIPVVSTWHSGIPELVRDEENGLLVQERDVKGLAEAIERFVLDPNLSVQTARRARESVERQHDVHKLNEQLTQIFLELVASA